VHGLVVGQDTVFSHDAWPGEEESEYVPIEPQTLVWELARKVKLRRMGRDDSEIAQVSEVTTTMGVLDAVFGAAAKEADDLAAARAAALGVLKNDSKLADPERSALTELALSLDSTWRVTAAWNGETDTQTVRSFAVWDCGRHGYWLRTQPEEPIAEDQVGPDSALVIVRSSASAIWDKLADLLPDREDLADEIA
jgi:hypothetical protein